MQDINQAALPASWLGYQLINHAAATDMSATVLPSDNALSGPVWLALTDADGDALYVAGIVVGVTFTAAAVRYSVAFPVAPQPREGETLYAVIENVESSLVLGELPEDETVFDAVLTEDAAALVPREPLVAVMDAVNPLAGAAVAGELTERVAALRSALATDADPMEMLGMVRDVMSLTAQVQAGEPAPVAELAVALPESAAPAVVAELTGDELGQFPDTPEGKKALRAAAKTYFTGLLGQMVPCPALGASVELRKRGMDKVMSLSGDARKLKLVPALKAMIGSAAKIGSRPSYVPEVETSVKAYHTLRASVVLGGEALSVRLVIREDNNGNCHWDHTVHAAEAVFDNVADKEKGSDESDPSSTATSNGGAGQTGASRLVSCQLDSILGDSGEVFNLFIEGEAPEVLADEPAAPSAQFATYRDWIAKELAAGKTIPAGTMEVIRMDTRLEDGEAEQLAALAAATPAPQEKQSMEQLIKIAADTLAQLRRIDVYRVLNSAGEQRAELATFIASGRADLVREVTEVMAEEWPDLGWTMAAPVVVEHTEGGELLVPNKDGTPKELVVPPVPEVVAKSEQELQNPARAGDMAFLNSVISQSVDMMADDLADRIEAFATTYDGDAEMLELMGRAIDTYTDFMVALA